MACKEKEELSHLLDHSYSLIEESETKKLENSLPVNSTEKNILEVYMVSPQN